MDDTACVATAQESIDVVGMGTQTELEGVLGTATTPITAEHVQMLLGANLKVLAGVLCNPAYMRRLQNTPHARWTEFAGVDTRISAFQVVNARARVERTVSLTAADGSGMMSMCTFAETDPVQRYVLIVAGLGVNVRVYVAPELDAAKPRCPLTAARILAGLLMRYEADCASRGDWQLSCLWAPTIAIAVAIRDECATYLAKCHDTIETNSPHMCMHCLGPATQRCKRDTVWYCCVACQKADWPTHRVDCGR